jgi:hypothetical protein
MTSAVALPPVACLRAVVVLDMRRGVRVRVLAAVSAIAVVLLVVPSAEAVPPGTFTRMFPKLAPFDTPTDQQLADLAQTMRDTGGASTDNLRLPAGVTFLGQFIDHDLTLDTEPSPIAPVNIRQLDNDRIGNFDLDSVYGDGPSRTPELYEADKKHLRTGVSNGIPDVPRRADGSAILGDGRNDENLIVLQLHAAFLRFHNRLVDEGYSFAEAQRLTRYHYQWIVLHEYLPDIVGQPTMDRFLRGNGEFYKPGNKHDPVLPIEFSVAAFRFGHSEVRPGYALNATTGAPIFSSSGPDLRGGRPIPAGHGIDWQRFFRIDGSTVAPQASKLIDTKISSGLFELPIPGAAASGSNVLAFRNMVRGKFYGLPSGQAVARAMGEPILPAGQGPGFEGATPLWFYILLDSQARAGGERLGPVGARIVAEVFVTNLRRDPGSYLSADPGFQPSVPHQGAFTMSDFLHFARVV